MKILITTDCYKPTVNGVVTSIINLETQLRKLGHEVRILCPSSNIHCNESGDIYRIGSVGAGKIYKGARAAFRMSKKNLIGIIKWKPDIIHSQSEFTSFIMAKKIAAAVGCPIIHTYHTVYENYTHYFSPSIKLGRKAAMVFTKKILNNVQAVIAPTKKVKDMLVNYGISKTISVIPTGLDLSKFNNKPSQEQLLQLRSELGIPEKNKVLITVGRAAREKNIDELINFVKKSDMTDVTLLIVGGGPYLNDLQKLVEELDISDKVKFTGMVSPDRIADYYSIGDIFVSASTSETQGLTYIEAMACGLPLVCRADECLNGVLSNEENGYSFENYTDFTESVKRILSNDSLYCFMKLNSKNIAQSYSNKVFAEKVIIAYQNTINKFNQEQGDDYEIENTLHAFKDCI